jgi:hypothetical protein
MQHQIKISLKHYEKNDLLRAYQNAKKVLNTYKSLKFYWLSYIVLSSPTRFGHSCCHLQDDFFDNMNTIVIRMYLNHFTVLGHRR